jgi:signal transduction histidine kinase
MIVIPAAVMAFLGYRSFDAEIRAERAERRSRVRVAFGRVYEEVREVLDRLEREETARPFWDWQPVVADLDAVTGDTIARRSPLASGPSVPFLEGHFEYDPESGKVSLPVTPPLGEDQVAQMKRDLFAAATFLPGVESELRSRPPRFEPGDAPAERRTHDARRFAENLRLRAGDAAQGGPAPAANGVVTVEYGAFRYRVTTSGVLALRPVRWNEDGRFRVLWQGFLIDYLSFVSDTFPALAARAGDPEVVARVVDTPVSLFAYPPNRSLGPMIPGLSLQAEERDPDAPARSIAAAQERFVLLIGALFAVIGVGLYLLHRTVRAELELARRRSDFVSAVSHELRTPLTGIRMYADMLRDGWVGEETVKEYHEAMARESERLSRLVQNVLDFSALEKGRKDYRFERGDLAEPVRAAVDLLEPYLTEKGFRVEADLPDDLPEVDRDADAVQQCVVNLVDNAVKYAKGGEPPEIEVSLARSGESIDLTVRDHGPGIPAADRDRVFETFFRRAAPEAAEVGGAGLGLALVRRCARAHGGDAAAEEAAGGGAVLRVSFPVPA